MPVAFRITLLSCVFTSVCALGCQVGRSAEMQDFATDQGRFEARFPGKPQRQLVPIHQPIFAQPLKPDNNPLQPKALDSDSGENPVIAYTVKTDDAIYSVEYKVWGLLDSEEAWLSQSERLKWNNGRITEQSEIKTCDGDSGRELRIQFDAPAANSEKAFVGRVFKAGGRFYLTYVQGLESAVNSLTAKEFLSTFRIRSADRPPGELHLAPVVGFEARFPAKPHYETDGDRTICRAEVDGLRCRVVKTPIPLVGEESYEEQHKRFDKARDQAKAHRDGTIRNDTYRYSRVVEDVNIRLENRYEGRMLRMDCPKESLLSEAEVCRVRFYCVGDSFFEVWAVGPADVIDGELVKQFLDSFRTVHLSTKPVSTAP